MVGGGFLFLHPRYYCTFLYQQAQEAVGPLYTHITYHTHSHHVIISKCKYTGATCLLCGCAHQVTGFRSCCCCTLICTRHSRSCTHVNLFPALHVCSSCLSPYGNQGRLLNDSPQNISSVSVHHNTTTAKTTFGKTASRYSMFHN